MAVLKYRDNNGNIKKLNNVKVKSGGTSFEKKCFVAVENATLSSNEDTSINGKSRALVNYDTRISLNATDIENMYFNYFVNEKNKIVSYDKTFNLWLTSDKMFSAVYSETEVERQPLVYFNNNGKVSIENSTILYNMSSRTYPCAKLEWGLILSPMNSTEEELVYDSGISTVLVMTDDASTATTPNADLRYTFSTAPTVFEKFSCMYARIYAIVIKDGVEEIIYSDIIKTVW